jgi:hypothetical protein
MPAVQIDIDQVRKMYLEENKSVPKIAEELGFSFAGIRQALLRHGVDLRTKKEAAFYRRQRAFGGTVPTEEWCRQALAAFSGNASECSAHYGFNYVTFVDLLKHYRIARLPPSRRRVTTCPFPVDEAADLSSSGVTYHELAARYGVQYSVILYWLKKSGHVAPKDKHKVWHEHRSLSTPKRRIIQDLKDLGYLPCEICGPNSHFDLAHIQEKKQGGPMHNANILLLCPNHHRAFDKGTLTKEEFERIKPRVRHAEQTLGFVLTRYEGW